MAPGECHPGTISVHLSVCSNQRADEPGPRPADRPCRPFLILDDDGQIGSVAEEWLERSINTRQTLQEYLIIVDISQVIRIVGVEYIQIG